LKTRKRRLETNSEEQVMKKAQRTQQQQPAAQVQGLITDGRLVVSKDGRYVTIYFADGAKIREPRNRLLSALGESFTAEPKKERDESPATLTTGFIAQTRMMLSRDSNYLLIYFPGGRFIRHVNYVRASLGLAYEPVAKPAMA
jgi:hypothetical protein